jgi:hypothetical protein
MFEVARTYVDTGVVGAVRRLGRFSVAARTIHRWTLASQARNDPPPRSEADELRLARATAECYEGNMLRAKDICDRYRIRMVVFLQPHVFSIGGRPWTPNERWAAGRMRKGLGDALRLCYPLLREKLALLRERQIPAYDISDAFDDNREPIFIDEYHVESTGNRLIAEAVLKRALPLLRDRGRSQSDD